MESIPEVVTSRDGSVADSARRDDSPVSARLPFWQRQFAPRPTLGQKLFDLVAGVMLPVLCIWLDPIVFNGSEPVLGSSPLGKYTVGGYTFIFAEVLVLLFWLLLGRRMGIGGGFVGGMLANGAIFACLLGFAIVPLTLLSFILMIPIGVLGLSPFVTSFVFLRNAIRALHGRDAPAGRVRWLFAILGAALAVSAPVVAQWEVNRLVYRLAQVNVEGRSKERAAEIERGLWVVRWFGIRTIDPLVDAYDVEEDRIAKECIADTYRSITGNNIESRLAALRD